METEVNVESSGDDFEQMSVRRAGRAATILNLSHFEPETVQRVFNDFFSLLSNRAIDQYIRNPETGKRRAHFVFVVDNGPSEAPSSPLVQMWLVRLARILQLKSVTQKSFAEYHSKRNPVERVHAVQNRALSNEIFKRNSVHRDYKVADAKHKENMEHVANEVKKCLSCVEYGGKSCLVVHGVVQEADFIFDYEAGLLTFLAKSEGMKNEDDSTYETTKNDLWNFA